MKKIYQIIELLIDIRDCVRNINRTLVVGSLSVPTEKQKIYYRVYDSSGREIFASVYLIDCLEFVKENQCSEKSPFTIHRVLYNLDGKRAFVVANVKFL